MAIKIIKNQYNDGEKWLVYCEDKEQLKVVLNGLQNENIDAIEYHTSMTSSMSETLKWYKNFGGVLVSIRCLDEGVDIPDISHALILASSQNPRQFIQRRGRVLRKAKNKYKAVIHDAIVTPLNLEVDPEQYSLIKGELCRSIEFAKSALNKTASAELEILAINLGLNIQTLALDGVE